MIILNCQAIRQETTVFNRIIILLVMFILAGSAAAGQSSTGDTLERCSQADLDWRTANKTNYTSYPEPGSEECIVYNGCFWEGQFSACTGKNTEAWVESINIAAVFPMFDELKNHELCIRKGSKLMIVNVIDTCGDSDCDGCCTENKGDAEALIDLESYTNARWGEEDSSIEWADLGERVPPVCN